MDWAAIHTFANEFALWTTVVINSWLLATASIFAFSFLRKQSLALSIRLLGAARGATFAIYTILNLAGFTGVTYLIIATSHRPAVKLALHIITIIAVFFWQWLGIRTWRRTRRGSV